MATDDLAGGGREGEREGALGYILSLPAAALPLPVAVSCLDATVPRKARSRPRLRAQPCSWWTFELPVPAPEEAKTPAPTAPAATNPTEEARPPRPQRPRPPVCQAPPHDPPPPAPAMERPAKRARRCLQCGAIETPQWRSGPMGSGTLCNACGVRLKAAGALREQVHRPPPATARTVAEPPPESPVSDSSPDGPIWEPGSVPDVYLLRKKPPKRGRSPPPRTEPASPPAPAVFLVKKKKTKKKKAPKTPRKKPWRPRKSAKRCLHCGSSSTPQWREGPMGRSTLCNACGVRYRQGRLLPEYRPLVSPTFEPSEHANRHSQVLQLHRQRKGHQKNQQPLPTEEPRPVDHPTGAPPCSGGGDDPMNVLLPRRWHNKNEYPPTPLHQPLPQPADSLAGDQHVGDVDEPAPGRGGSNNDPNDAPSSLDPLLLEGPSAPLIVDGDEPFVD